MPLFKQKPLIYQEVDQDEGRTNLAFIQVCQENIYKWDIRKGMVFFLSIIYYGSESIQINVLPLLLLFSLWKLQSGSPAGLTMLNTQGGGWAISKAVKFFNKKLFSYYTATLSR